MLTRDADCRHVVPALAHTRNAVSTSVVSDPSSSAPRSDGRPGNVEEALVKAARTLTSHLDEDGVCAAVLDAVENVFGATSSWILLYDARNQTAPNRVLTRARE